MKELEVLTLTRNPSQKDYRFLLTEELLYSLYYGIPVEAN